MFFLIKFFYFLNSGPLWPTLNPLSSFLSTLFLCMTPVFLSGIVDRQKFYRDWRGGDGDHDSVVKGQYLTVSAAMTAGINGVSVFRSFAFIYSIYGPLPFLHFKPLSLLCQGFGNVNQMSFL